MLARLVRPIADAGRDLRIHPGRSALTSVSLVIGVLGVIGLTVAGGVVEDVFIANEEQRSARAVTVAAPVAVEDLSLDTLTRLDQAAKTILQPQGGSYAMVGEPQGASVLVSGQPSRQDDEAVRLYFVAGSLPGVRRMPLLEGTWLDPLPSTVYPPIVVVNGPAAARVGGMGAVVSVVMSVGHSPIDVRVAGVVADGVDQANVYASLPTAITLESSANLTSLLLYVHHPSPSSQALSDILQAISAAASLTVDRTPVRVDGVGRLDTAVATTRSALSAASAVALALAALGVLNIGLASLTSRSRELFIRRAVGARRTDLFLLVLLDGVAIAMVSSFAAVVLARVIYAALTPMIVDPSSAIEVPAFPFRSALLGIGAGLVAALVGGLVPAFRAARLDPGVALRD